MVMDDPIIYNYFKRKLGHDIAEMLYDLTRNHIAITREKTLIYSKRIRNRRKVMHSVENHIKIIEVEPDTYVDFTVWFKLISGVDRRNGTVAHVSSRKMLANELRVGELNMTNCSNTILEPGMWELRVYAKMLSAGKIVVDIDRCRLIVRSG